MVARGAQGSEEEFGEIVQYLTKNFPPQSGGAAATASKVNVNKAAAPELKTELELSDKEAAAIVSYRQQNGDFKSVEQLEKVPGLDASKIEAKKSRIIF
jgi:competence protein ComEA